MTFVCNREKERVNVCLCFLSFLLTLEEILVIHCQITLPVKNKQQQEEPPPKPQLLATVSARFFSPIYPKVRFPRFFSRNQNKRNETKRKKIPWKESCGYLTGQCHIKLRFPPSWQRDEMLCCYDSSNRCVLWQRTTTVRQQQWVDLRVIVRKGVLPCLCVPCRRVTMEQESSLWGIMVRVVVIVHSHQQQ